MGARFDRISKRDFKLLLALLGAIAVFGSAILGVLLQGAHGL